MFSFFYNVLLAFLSIGFFPKILYQYYRMGKYRKSLKGRLGLGFDSVEKGERPLIWIHGPSLGETKAIVKLAKKIRTQSPNAYLLITSTTETGHEEAKKSISFADNHLFLPFDFGWIIRPIVKRIKPSIVILCESDFWFNFLDECKQNGAQVCLVNGKMSVKSMERYLWFAFFSKRLFSNIDLFCLQSERYLKRFTCLGVPKEKILVTGNIKFDNAASILSPLEAEIWKEKLKISSSLIVVAGSTHNPEEMILLETLESIWNQFPDTKLLLVPRHPERFSEVAQLLKNRQIAFTRLSEIERGSGTEKVILIDAVGILKDCYQICDIAFVGGSFSEKVGGHNILEPCSYAKPVIYGQHMHSQLDLVEFMNEFKTGIQTTPEEFPSILARLIESEEERNELGAAGLKLMNAMQGASEKTFQALQKNFIF